MGYQQHFLVSLQHQVILFKYQPLLQLQNQVEHLPMYGILVQEVLPYLAIHQFYLAGILVLEIMVQVHSRYLPKAHLQSMVLHLLLLILGILGLLFMTFHLATFSQLAGLFPIVLLFQQLHMM